MKNLVNRVKRFLPRYTGSGVTLVVCDLFDVKNINTFQARTLGEALREAFTHKPTSARLFLNDITPENDITIASSEFLEKVQGRVICIHQPADPITAIIAIASVIVGVAVAFLFTPVIPNGSANSAPSPTNSLTNRTNQQRLGQRIQDGFGTNWMIPDLLTPTFSVFLDHEEYEFSHMVLGVGEYDILQAKEDTTPAQQIPGTTVQFHKPSEHFAGAIQKQFGNDLTTLESFFGQLLVKRYEGINGQVLPPPDNFFEAKDTITFVHPNIIRNTGSGSFIGSFVAGETVTVSEASELGSAGNLTHDHDADTQTPNVPITYTLDGTYTITSVTEKEIVLSSPEVVNSDWQELTSNSDSTVLSDSILSTESDNLWTEWQYTNQQDMAGFMVTLIAPNGLYVSNGEKHASLYVNTEIEYETLNEQGEPTGIVTTQRLLLEGKNAKVVDGVYAVTTDNRLRETAAKTYHFYINQNVRFRTKRTTRTWRQKGGTNVDELRVRDFMSFSYLQPSQIHNDCTTIFTKTRATAGALRVKQRKLQVQATRKVRNWQDNDSLIATNRAEHIFYHIATEPHLGNLNINDLDIQQITDELEVNRTYFETDKCAEFCHVFDDSNLTTEETLQAIAQSVFCTANRFGKKIRLHFERPEPMSMVQFTGYNIAPDSYQRTENFGMVNDHDGVELTYRSDADGSPIIKRYPDQGETNPKKIQMVGIANDTQAQVHLMRAYQKIKYANVNLRFMGMDETNILLPTHRINVADRTNAKTQDGQVESLDIVEGKAVVTTSEPVYIQDGVSYTLHLQQANGSVENIPVSKGDNLYQLVLERLPSNTVSFGAAAVVSAGYELANSMDDGARQSFLVTSKSPAEGMSHEIEAINYTDKYYQHDKDHVSSIYQAKLF